MRWLRSIRLNWGLRPQTPGIYRLRARMAYCGGGRSRLLPFRLLSRRSGCVPALPYPPLRYFQSGSHQPRRAMIFHRAATNPLNFLSHWRGSPQTSSPLSRGRSPQVRYRIFPLVPPGSTRCVSDDFWASLFPASLPPAPGLAADLCSCGRKFATRFFQFRLAATPCVSLRLSSSTPSSSFHLARFCPPWHTGQPLWAARPLSCGLLFAAWHEDFLSSGFL